ncbi:MAG: hypothetical protein ABL860_06085 [Candidatus Nitrotoga sp.]
MKTPRATPAGFMLDAVEFLKAAELLLNRAGNVSLPIYFLFCRSIELSLKAFLLHCGVNAKNLAERSLGHNLLALAKVAQKHGLSSYVSLNPPEQGMIELLALEYQGTKLGYRVTGDTYYLPPIDHTENIARKLVSGLREVCETSSANADT